MCLVTAGFVRQRWNTALMRRFLPSPIRKRTYSTEWLIVWHGDFFEIVEHQQVSPEVDFFEYDDIVTAERTESFRKAALAYVGGAYLVRVLLAAEQAELLRASLVEAHRQAKRRSWHYLDFSMRPRDAGYNPRYDYRELSATVG